MSFPRPSGLPAICARFGDPLTWLENKLGWERITLSSWPLEQPLMYAYDISLDVHTIRAHRLIAQELAEALAEAQATGVPRARLKYGGCYSWRAKRGSPFLSLHTWGIAVDLEPATNPLGRPWRDDGVMLAPEVIAVFKLRGWKWGGEFEPTPDPMHFQWAENY